MNDTAADGNSALVIAAMTGRRLASFLLDAALIPIRRRWLPRCMPPFCVPIRRWSRRCWQGGESERSTDERYGSARWTYQFVLTAKQLGRPFTLAAKFGERDHPNPAIGGADPLIPMNDGTTALMAGRCGLESRRRSARLIAPELIAAERENEARVLDTVRLLLKPARQSQRGINESNRAGDTACTARY